MESLRRTEISKRLSYTLDCLGYGQEMVRFRQGYYDQVDMFNSVIAQIKFPSHLRFVMVGSKAEGLVKQYESDMDMLLRLMSCVCVESVCSCQYLSDTLTIFLLVPCTYHPGHFKLVLQRCGKNISNLKKHLKQSQLGVVLSRGSFLTSVPATEYDRISGPAYSTSVGSLDSDMVMTLPCVAFSILTRWLNRPRKHNWPPAELKHTISQMSCNVVANGIRGCDDEDIEWRLCFNEIELLLVRSWNDIQTKVYKMLKMIKRDILRPSQKEVTSFILKNIVLWLSEEFPQSEFRHDNLLEWVVKALRLLKRAIKLHYLPYYMLPERNLLTERIEACQRRKLMKDIRNIIRCGPHLLLDCEKIKFSMKLRPVELGLYHLKVCAFEKQFMRVIISVMKTVLNLHDSQSDFLVDVRLFLPLPTPVLDELDKCSSVKEKVEFLLS